MSCDSCAGPTECGQEDSDQESDNPDHDQKLNECETFALVHNLDSSSTCFPEDSAPCAQRAHESNHEKCERCGFREIGQETVGGGEGIEGRHIGCGCVLRSTACKLIKIVGHEDEILAVDDAVIVEVALVPVGCGIVEIGGHDGEVGAVDLAVKIGVAVEGVSDLDLTGGQTGRIVWIGRVGVTDAVAGVEACDGAVDPGGAVSLATVVAVDEVLTDAGDRIGARTVVDDEIIIGDVECRKSVDRQRRYGASTGVGGELQGVFG